MSLLQAGTAAFAQDGYQAAGIEAISRAARVTRGAFYYHFDDKKALFDAVVVQLQVEAAARIEASARAQHKIWDRLSTGIDAYLDICLEPVYGRIVIQEAPVVLGPVRFQEIEEAHPLALLAATLNALKQCGELQTENVALLTRMLDAMICKLALMLTGLTDTSELRADGHRMIAALLGTMRRT